MEIDWDEVWKEQMWWDTVNGMEDDEDPEEEEEDDW